MRREFMFISMAVLVLVGIATWFWPQAAWSLVVLGPILLIGVNDMLQNRHAIRHNFPVIGNLRYIFELIPPKLQQYFVEWN